MTYIQVREADMMRDEAPPPIETRHAPPSPKKELSRAVRSVPAIVTTTTKSSTPGIDMAPFKKMKMIGMPENAIRGRMAAMGIEQNDIDGFFGHKGPEVKASKLSTSVSMPTLKSVKRTEDSKAKRSRKASLKDLLNAKRKQLHSLDLKKLAQEKEEYEREKMESDPRNMFKDIFAERRKVLGTDNLSSSGEEWSDDDDADDGFFD